MSKSRPEDEVYSLSIGSKPDNDLVFDRPTVSGRHAHIYWDAEARRWMLEDLGSTNGSYVNEEKVTRQRLHHKDSIRIGWNMFTFIDENEVNLEKTSEIKKSWIPGIYFSK
jgi:pSer/pThr/pTyr-binding forkhead associated (FHA) protein